jgi:hypothetical protein
MLSRCRVFGTIALVATVGLPLSLPAQTPAASPAPPAQGGRPMAGGAMGDPQHQTDMEVFHYLVDHGKEITRTVTQLPNGVDTLTESTNADVAAKIKLHVASMTARVEDRRPIHRRDPLFAEIFAHADTIEMKSEPTPNGVRVVETSTDPYVVKLIQAHADVVTGFIKNGRSEMMKNHPVPER